MKTPKDIRSTGRKRGRATLFIVRRKYACRLCGITSTKKPPDAPQVFEKLWPILEPGILSTESALQCNHINKNILDCDPSNLEWLCPPCHKLEDSRTDKGISVIENEFGY